ncbi:hypothetical protein DFS33DRAFT_1269790 [Desarmillaria ectypa]|nr:hypothetical protein DFS33DRAFT_1269790 [Desarmillaria ectypa]
MPQALPPNPFDSFSDEHAAYKSCLNLETVGNSWGVAVYDLAKESSEAAMFKFIPEVAARVLGFALIHSPSKACLAREISSCDDNRKFIASLSYLCVMGMIRIFHSPRPSFQATADNIATLLSQPTASLNYAKKLDWQWVKNTVAKDARNF